DADATPQDRRMHSPDRAPPATRTGLPTVLIAFACLSLSCALPGLFADRATTHISQYFFAVQDAPVLLLLGATLLVLACGPARSGTQPTANLFARMPGASLTVAIAVATVGIAWLGAHVIMQSHGLSLDEFWADFDAKVFASGRLIMPVAPEWRDYVPAMQPI